MKNMKIKTRLIGTFAMTIILALIVVLVSQVGSIMTNDKYDKILDVNVASSDAFYNARILANIAARNLQDMVIEGYTSEKEDQINTYLGNMDVTLELLKDLYPLSDNAVVDYIAAMGKWESIVPTIIATMKSGNELAARQMIINQSTPALNAMSKSSAVVTANIVAQNALRISEVDFLTSAVKIASVVFTVFAVAFVLIMVIKLIKDLIGPLNQAVAAMEDMSHGDFDKEISYHSTNEIGIMMEALRRSRQVLNGVVTDVSKVASEMADGNFTVTMHAEFPGGLQSIRAALELLIARMSSTLENISQSADQVSAGADQVSNSAQALAQGATEQASAVQELSSTVNNNASSAKNNASTARQSKDLSLQAGTQVNVCADFMKEMVSAMNNISKSSEEIGKIISTIENIAFQTNILALNAAVEAARAGTAGKGFAVVADEVRNLASKSDQAAKATKELIENSIGAVKNGSQIVGNVSAALEKTIDLAGQAVTGMEIIVAAVDRDAEAMAQLSEGIDQISSVVQTNSATSEESAAASEELSSQAMIMHQLLSGFQLNKREGATEYQHHTSTNTVHAPRREANRGRGVSDGDAFGKY